MAFLNICAGFLWLVGFICFAGVAWIPLSRLKVNEAIPWIIAIGYSLLITYALFRLDAIDASDSDNKIKLIQLVLIVLGAGIPLKIEAYLPVKREEQDNKKDGR